MSKRYELKTFVRYLTTDILEQYFKSRDYPFDPKLQAEEPETIESYINSLDEKIQEQINIDFASANEISTENGILTLIDLLKDNGIHIQDEAIKKVLGQKTNPRPKTHSFPYTGIMKCGECGCSITAMEKEKIQKNGNKHKYTYYCCTKKRGKCSQKYIEVTELEKQFNKTIESIYIPPEFAEWAVEELKKEHQKEKESRQANSNLNIKNYENSVRKIEKLLESYLSGDVPQEVYKAKMSELDKEKRLAKSMIDHTDERVNDWIKKAEEMFDFAVHAKEEFENGSIEKKREIVSRLGLNFILFNKKVAIELDNPIEKIKEVAPKVKLLAERFEPLEVLENKGKLEEVLTNDSSWGD